MVERHQRLPDRRENIPYPAHLACMAVPRLFVIVGIVPDSLGPAERLSAKHILVLPHPQSAIGPIATAAPRPATPGLVEIDETIDELERVEHTLDRAIFVAILACGDDVTPAGPPPRRR